MILSLCRLSDAYIERFRDLTGEEISVARLNGECAAILEKAEVVIAQDRDFSRALECCPGLKLGLVVSAGVDRLPFQDLIRRGVRIANAGSVSAEAMSDYAMGAILMFSSRLLHCHENQRRRYWEPYLYTAPVRDCRLLIVGAGKIGGRIAEKARAFGMIIEGVSRSARPNPAFDAIFTLSDLDARLALADYVVCTIPLTDETRRLFDGARFSGMKPGAVFINLARGAVCDQDALARALSGGRLGGAALDVFSPEPLPADSPLWDMENVLITPHSSGRLKDYAEYTCEVFAENYLAWKRGGELVTPVDLERQY